MPLVVGLIKDDPFARWPRYLEPFKMIVQRSLPLSVLLASVGLMVVSVSPASAHTLVDQNGWDVDDEEYAVRTSPIDLTAYSDSVQSYESVEKICYIDLGCFTKDGPMKQTGILPQTPLQIGTQFYVYTAAKRTGEVLIDPYKPATFAPVNAKKTVAIIAHGFGNSHNTKELVAVKDALLDRTLGEVETVIFVDWKKGAAQPFYNEASTNTQVVGRQITFLVNELIKHSGVKPEKVYLIGFSLGAQVAGFAGKWSQTEYKWKYGRITGLDAAAPMFEEHPGSFLTKADATFVDAIHTSAGSNLLKGQIGFIAPYGHVDFYPNGGHNQPWCTSIFHITCNHYASVLLYTSSLTAKTKCTLSAYACANYELFLKGATASCKKTDTVLGYDAIKSQARGVQYLTTKAEFPYCA